MIAESNIMRNMNNIIRSIQGKKKKKGGTRKKKTNI